MLRMSLGLGLTLVLDGVKLRWGGSESARLLQPWQLELVTLCACRSPPSPASIAAAGRAHGLLKFPPKTEFAMPEGLYEHHR